MKKTVTRIAIFALLIGGQGFANTSSSVQEKDQDKGMDDEFALMRYRMHQILDSMDDFYKDVSSRWNDVPENAVTTSSFTYSPNVDVKQTDKQIIVTCDLPGLDKDKIDISLKERVLSLRGKREEDKTFEEEQNGQYVYKSIRNYGEFQRNVTLPEGVKEDSVKASYKDGVLTVTMDYEKPQEPQAAIRKFKVE